MLLLERDNENIEIGKEIGKEIGRGNLCFELVLEGVLSATKAAEKLSISEKEFFKQYEIWKKENANK